MIIFDPRYTKVPEDSQIIQPMSGTLDIKKPIAGHLIQEKQSIQQSPLLKKGSVIIGFDGSPEIRAIVKSNLYTSLSKVVA